MQKTALAGYRLQAIPGQCSIYIEINRVQYYAMASHGATVQPLFPASPNVRPINAGFRVPCVRHASMTSEMTSDRISIMPARCAG